MCPTFEKQNCSRFGVSEFWLKKLAEQKLPFLLVKIQRSILVCFSSSSKEFFRRRDIFYAHQIKDKSHVFDESVFGDSDEDDEDDDDELLFASERREDDFEKE